MRFGRDIAKYLVRIIASSRYIDMSGRCLDKEVIEVSRIYRHAWAGGYLCMMALCCCLSRSREISSSP